MNKPARIIIDGSSEFKDWVKVTYNSGLVKDLKLDKMSITDLIANIYSKDKLDIDDQLIFKPYVVTYEIGENNGE